MKARPKSKRKDSARKTEAERRFLRTVHLNAAGIDIGSESHWVCVPEGRDEHTVREFSATTTGLHALSDWLQHCEVETVAMESTGVYWIPLFELLEERGLQVHLVNARHVKNVSGRKDDETDCQWLQKLHTFGLLRGSFRPEAEVTTLRSYLRHRQTLVEQAASWVQRMQKALSLMNVLLHKVVADITGVTGMRIMRAIVAGDTDPRALAQHRDYRCRKSEDEIAEALTGHYRPEHVFALSQALQLYDTYQCQLQACDEQIASVLQRLVERSTAVEEPVPAARRRFARNHNEPQLDIRSPLWRMCGGVDLTALPGLAPHSALKLVSEVGLDMSRWKTAKHFVSWLTLAPQSKRSGGKLLSSRTVPSKNRAAAIFRLAAMNLGRSDHALGAFYRRLSHRVGKAKAITATARKLAILFYRTLREGLQYDEVPADSYDAQQRQRVLRSLRKRAKTLGFELLNPETGEVLA